MSRPNMGDERCVRYFSEPLPGDRAQLYADLLGDDGKIEATYPVGSPAPRAPVAAMVDKLQPRALKGGRT